MKEYDARRSVKEIKTNEYSMPPGNNTAICEIYSALNHESML